MTVDDLIIYTVKVGSGSGCLFQPDSEDFTYIITAKHLFYDKVEDDRGKPEQFIKKEKGTEIPIVRNVRLKDSNGTETIPFYLDEGENYFPHHEADIAILKLSPAVPGFGSIIAQEQILDFKGFALCGYPEGMGREYTSHNLKNFIGSSKYSYSARIDEVLSQSNIEGMSGGGILKLQDKTISIIGIQSKMASTGFVAGQIAFIQMKYAHEIILYEENKGKLVNLAPPFLNFKFLRNESFKLEVDFIDEDKIKNARMTLRNKALEIINSDITPSGIKKLFETRLLVVQQSNESLFHKAVWIAWLEFLTIMNIVKYEKIDTNILSELFDSYRLKYAATEDWTTLFRKELRESDYKGLKPDSTIIISTLKPPIKNFVIPKGKLLADISSVGDKSGFQTDKGIDPYSLFQFVHIDYFMTPCIIEKLEQYQDLSEEQLIGKLKKEYNGLFDNISH